MFFALEESIFSCYTLPEIILTTKNCGIHVHFRYRRRTQTYKVKQQKTDIEHWGKTEGDSQGQATTHENHS